jgi:hypothetical protein
MCSVPRPRGPQLECQVQGQEHHRESAHAGRVRSGDQSHPLEHILLLRVACGRGGDICESE